MIFTTDEELEVDLTAMSPEALDLELHFARAMADPAWPASYDWLERVETELLARALGTEA